MIPTVFARTPARPRLFRHVALIALLVTASSGTNAAEEFAGSAKLVDVFLSALERNPTYLAELSAVRAVDRLERVAEGQLLPQVGLGASYDYGKERVRGDYYAVENVDSSDTYGQGVFGVKLTQSVYRPDLWISRDQAELKTSLARFELEQAEDNLLLEVVAAYLGVLSAQDVEGLTRAELEAVERQSSQVRGRGQAGLALESDVLAADAHRSTAAAELIAVKGKLEAAYAALDLVAGQPFRNLRALPEGMVVTHPQPAYAQAWAEKAREQNLAVIRARLNTRIAALEAEKTRATRMPKVQVVGSAGYLDLSGGISGERSERDARIGVDLSVPIYAGGSIEAGIEAADATAQRAESLLQAARAKAEHDARVAYTAMVSSYSRVPAQREAVMAARAAEASVEGGFDAGTRTSADVLRAVEERYDAEKAYSAARYGHMIDGLRLKLAAGILVNSDLHQLDRLLRASPEQP